MDGMTINHIVSIDHGPYMLMVNPNIYAAPYPSGAGFVLVI